jgi:hypothetical protein
VIRHSDGETIRLRRAGEEGTDFVLLEVPEGRSAGPAWRRTALGNGLRALQMDDVRRFVPPVPDDAVGLLFVTTDGLNFVVDLFKDEDGHWAHFTVSAEPEREADSGANGQGAAEPAGNTLADAAEDLAEDLAETADELAAAAGEGGDAVTDAALAAVEDEAGSQDTEATGGEADAAAAADPYAQRLTSAVAADARLSPWLFKIPERRYDDLSLRLEALLEPLAEDD